VILTDSGVVRPLKVGQLPRVSSRLPRVWLADSWWLIN